MQFYSGFSLIHEEYLFESYLSQSDYTICGFSYGAIKAYEATCEALENGQRVDTLQLFSPAFFQTKDAKFKRLQLMSYKKNKLLYMKNFLALCFAPYELKVVQNVETKVEELQELLEYVWDREGLKKIHQAGVTIEVYLGGEDKIIDALSAKDFFLDVATVTYIKDANHFLLNRR